MKTGGGDGLGDPARGETFSLAPPAKRIPESNNRSVVKQNRDGGFIGLTNGREAGTGYFFILAGPRRTVQKIELPRSSAGVKTLFNQSVQGVPSYIVGHGRTLLGLDAVEDELVDTLGFKRNLKMYA